MAKTNYKVLIAAIAGITIMECVALYKGYNGYLLTTVLALVAGLAGWTMPQLKAKK